jgi:hypothetical protein
MNEGLVAPSWSDSGDVPVGEVTYRNDGLLSLLTRREQEDGAKLDFTKPPRLPSDPNAKPAMSALSKVAGESYRGLGWCDE